MSTPTRNTSPMEQNEFLIIYLSKTNILKQNYLFIQGHVVEHLTEEFTFEKKDWCFKPNHTPSIKILSYFSKIVPKKVLTLFYLGEIPLSLELFWTTFFLYAMGLWNFLTFNFYLFYIYVTCKFHGLITFASFLLFLFIILWK